jgi:triacylglycerol lipase
MADQNQAAAPDPLTLATLYLCNIAYTQDITTIPALVLKTPVPMAGAQWRCMWGPTQDSDQSNLVFVAGFFPTPTQGPQSICVTIRGTDVDVDDIWGVFEQIWEDLDAAYQTRLPWAPPGDQSLIARGTLDGLQIIEGLTSNGQSLANFLTQFYAVPTRQGVTAIVTGHSLGGCLATVVAPWMRAMLPSNVVIQPITFAAPTAGNNAFAQYYTTTFQTARRFENTLDIIPKAFQSLGDIDGIYGSYGLWAPYFVEFSIDGMIELMKLTGASYVQPSRGQQILPGAFLLNDRYDWYAQALHQHHLATYLSLLTGTALDEAALPKSTAPRTRPRTAPSELASAAR